MLAKIRAAEEAKKEVERKAAKEAAEQKLSEEKTVTERVGVAGSSGTSTQAAESALTLEKHRLKKLEESEAVNQSLKSRSNEDFSIFEKQIARVIKQIRATKDYVSQGGTQTHINA
ncbi:hypothetical protein Bca101_065833 [Brassica carinata]